MSQGTAAKQNGKRNIVLGIVVALVAAVIYYAVRRGFTFDLRSFLQQIRRISPVHAIAAVLLIYATYLLRSIRWVVFLRSQKRIPLLSLVGTQFTGFTAVALFGRIADLSRPFLVAQKTGTALPGQIAVYTIERMFDLGAAALIFSSALAFTPSNLPHHEIFVRVGVASLAGTLLLAAFAVAIRVAGVKLASAAARLLTPRSSGLAASVENKLLAFRAGLSAINSLSEFLLVSLMSLCLWLLIAFAYVEAAHAFTAEPTLAALSFPQTMLLMGASIGGSLLQLPIVGWFTQIATTAAAMHAFYGTPLETATACGALLLLVTFISVIPVGLVYARIDRVRLGDLRQKSATLEETA